MKTPTRATRVSPTQLPDVKPYIACHLSHQQHLSSQYNNSHMTTLKRTTPRENFATVANGVQAHALARYNASLGDGVGGPEEGCLDLSSRELHFHRNLPR